MKKLFYPIGALLLCLVFTSSAFGQRVVKIDASTDPATPTDIFPVIMGDTTATGERTDNNTIYQLENGQVYVTTGRMVNTSDWILHIEAEDLNDLDNKPILTRRPNASGTYPDIGRPEGDVTLRNVWIISGERGPLEEHDWGRLRISGAGSRVIVENCIIEKERGGFLQFRADSIKCYVDGTIFRNGGNRRILQGNGRAVDARNFVIDTLIITNSVVHNIQDRFLRSQGATVPHNYIKIDHCTSFNTVGRHGHIQLGRVVTAEITNNLFINPIMLGSSPAYTDEQTQPDGDLHKVITVDTLYANTQMTISNNNIFWTQDVLDYWASVDSINAPGVLSELVKDNLGDDTTNAFFAEPLSLDSIPGTVLPYVQDIYADPTATDMFDIIVEDVAVAGTGFDSGNLFDFSAFSTCYGVGTTSATASTSGGAIGAVSGCDFTTNLLTRPDQNGSLTVYPNPAVGVAHFEFELAQAGEAQLEIYDLSGRRLAVMQAQPAPGRLQVLTWQVPGELKGGLYLARLQAADEVRTVKFMVR